jgi:hypothetical protein
VESLVYLGTDFTARARLRSRALKRFEQVQIRARLAQHLPVSSRPEIVADAAAALWLEGGTIYRTDQLRTLTSALAAGLRGHRPPGRVQHRSRMVEHLVYEPGELRTHPAIRSTYFFWRALEKWWSPARADLWTQIWRRRRACIVGPVVVARKALATLGIEWRSPTCFHRAGESVDIRLAPGLPAESSRWWHDAREQLRAAAWAKEAARRPKDFRGAETGIRRSGIRALRWSAAGPTVMTAGMWTAQRMALCSMRESFCARCGGAPETTMHRLWECPSESSARADLLTSLPLDLRRLVPEGLPPCLRRCALVPSHFPWDDAIGFRIQLYIVCVAARAEEALAADRPRRIH